NGANCVNLLLDISRNELPIPTHTSFHIDTMVRMADSADTLRDLLSLLADALVARQLLASHFSFLLELLQACGVLWRAPRTAFVRLAARARRCPCTCSSLL